MCGIAGMFNTAVEAVVDAPTIHRMCQTIIHRGPDDEGIYVKGGVGLGMRRLSIIDLSGGQQPIHNEDKTVWVVFNGEIYNFRELRAELERGGHRFYTNTDTEVIVHLYEDLGSNFVLKLRGMFAIALYDERRRSLVLARDRLGKKPLHYSFTAGQFLFGSEIKSLLAVAPELAEVDQEAILQYFYFGYILDPATAFRSIRKLPPGFLLEFANGKTSLRRYWDLPTYGTAGPKSEEEYLEELENQLDEAVRIRLISDVPLGALLSGGVDSSTIVALMARASSRPVKTFTIGFSREDFNEARAARVVSERFGTEHHELVVEPKIGETLQLSKQIARRTICRLFNTSHFLRIPVDPAARNGRACRRRRGRTICRLRTVCDRVGAREFSMAFRTGRDDVTATTFIRVCHQLLPAEDSYSTFHCRPRDRYLDSLSFLPACHRERGFVLGRVSRLVLSRGSAAELFSELFRQCARRQPVESLALSRHQDLPSWRHPDQSRPHEHGGIARGACSNS